MLEKTKKLEKETRVAHLKAMQIIQSISDDPADTIKDHKILFSNSDKGPFRIVKLFFSEYRLQVASLRSIA